MYAEHSQDSQIRRHGAGDPVFRLNRQRRHDDAAATDAEGARKPGTADIQFFGRDIVASRRDRAP